MGDLVLSIADWPELREALGEPPKVEIVEWTLEGPPPRKHIDLVVPQYLLGGAPLARLAEVSVRLVQWPLLGFDGLDRFLPAGVPLANGKTVHEASAAEFALGLVIAAQRDIPRFVRNATEGRWHLEMRRSVADRRILIAGYGGVGLAFEARLAGLETHITRVDLVAHEQLNLAGERVRVHGVDELPAVLHNADIVVLCLPLTTETRGFLDARALAALPDDALVVNVGRGPLIVTDDLLAELRAGRLRAALDVTDPEPLPAQHPLWAQRNALITPHAAGSSDAMVPRMAALLRRQIRALQGGETPENIVLGIWSGA